MCSGTLSAIANAADFLTYFRKLPRNQRDLLAPHLDEPQRIGLKHLTAVVSWRGRV
ncbi:MULTISPECIES: hypothetical protein [Cyanophyceae]|uniref:hypothetical protein n=1 Tax=Cyanophyceae TaxID=3028117 RepID=UPI0016840466|nr:MULTISPECIES: hypothetical protein [Cyanophyceae]MBD1918314.1 hypothetical protein [Phormidium sp. FACHB-77]MBD2028830.1 hypothetical protein [Phormidium sp. FACHB-322]MBD2051251.1 hypothetical protein [Leptolyngbya sp. FACHB-60]